MRCPICGKFVSKAIAFISKWNDDIIKVEAHCKIHGLVNPQDWEYDDFITEDKVFVSNVRQE